MHPEPRVMPVPVGRTTALPSASSAWGQRCPGHRVVTQSNAWPWALLPGGCCGLGLSPQVRAGLVQGPRHLGTGLPIHMWHPTVAGEHRWQGSVTASCCSRDVLALPRLWCGGIKGTCWGLEV